MVSTWTKDPPLVVPLAEATALGRSRVGGNAYDLACLAAAVVTVDGGAGVVEVQ